MSRHPAISTPAWRAALGCLILIPSVTVLAALLIAGQGRTINAAQKIDPLDEQWQIRSGRAETDRLVLNPTADSIGLALHPIDSSSFTLQARLDLAEAGGSGGLIVQADDADHFTAFVISADGYFRVSDYRQGAWIVRAAWRAWPHIRRGGAVNLLRAECRSDSCTFFVNDEWTWEELGVTATRWIGVVAGAREARFDQISGQP